MTDVDPSHAALDELHFAKEAGSAGDKNGCQARLHAEKTLMSSPVSETRGGETRPWSIESIRVSQSPMGIGRTLGDGAMEPAHSLTTLRSFTSSRFTPMPGAAAPALVIACG